MKVLFISSGNSNSGLNPIIQNQAISLKKLGITIDHFVIKEKGVYGYLKNVFHLRKYLRTNNFDLIHAHYSFTGFVASLTLTKIPVVTSLMGSDVFQSKHGIYLIRFFTKFFWNKCIVKSVKMKKKIGNKNILVLPNGVNLDRFKPLNKSTSQEYLGWDKSKTQVFFCANPERYEKNYQLVEDSINLLPDMNNFEVHYAKGINNDEISYYYNASDVVLLSSLWEGSPNSIKEAMACNRPIVSTNVGDVTELFENLRGCYIADFYVSDYSSKIKLAIEFSKSRCTKGRDKIIELGLDAEKVSENLIVIYKDVLNK